MSSAEKIKKLFAKSEVTVNSKVDERIISNALAVFGKSEDTTLISAGPNIWRMIMNNRITKLAAAAVIIIAVLLGINYISGSPDGASVAWADVLENIEAARTVMYIREFESSDVKEVFKTRIIEPYRYREDVIESSDKCKVVIRNTKLNKNLLLYPHTKMAVIGDDGDYVDYELRAYERLKRDFRDGTEKNLGRIKLNGRETICFEISKENKKITVWADPNTALPIQIEEISDENGDKKKVVRSDIKFDVEFDEQLFSLTPPSDYCLLDLETQRLQTPFELTEQHLIEGLAVYPKYLDGKFRTRYMGGRPMTEEVKRKCLADVEKIQNWSDEDSNKSTFGCAFIEQLPEDSDYQYVGEDVKLGDANKPVCWWRPPGSKTYRVVYGDLSVRDVMPSDLPEVPWLKNE
ncbi:MAG: LolA family protein [Planctomycetota bacterium]|jgi:outer membrane lipoprotein-sorting protein